MFSWREFLGVLGKEVEKMLRDGIGGCFVGEWMWMVVIGLRKVLFERVLEGVGWLINLVGEDRWVVLRGCNLWDFEGGEGVGEGVLGVGRGFVV
jgi:hypothetical protein